jgi:hypothetical protein
MKMEDDHTTPNGDGGTIVPAQPRINPFALFRQRNSGGGTFFRGDLLKCDFRSGEWVRVRGENETQIEPDERFIVNPHGMIDSWTKFVDGKRVAQKVFRTADGELAPERKELGDNDESEWPTRNSRPKDPWARAVYLPMKGGDGEVVAFKATGSSAIGEIGELVGMYASADRHGKFPVVELQTRNFESQHGSVIYVPVFRLVSWAFWEADRPAPAVALVSVPPPAPSPPPPAKPAAIATRKPVARSDMDDEIPFAWAAMAAIPLLALLSGSGSLFI